MQNHFDKENPQLLLFKNRKTLHKGKSNKEKPYEKNRLVSSQFSDFPILIILIIFCGLDANILDEVQVKAL